MKGGGREGRWEGGEGKTGGEGIYKLYKVVLTSIIHTY